MNLFFIFLFGKRTMNRQDVPKINRNILHTFECWFLFRHCCVLHTRNGVLESDERVILSLCAWAEEKIPSGFSPAKKKVNILYTHIMNFHHYEPEGVQRTTRHLVTKVTSHSTKKMINDRQEIWIGEQCPLLQTLISAEHQSKRSSTRVLHYLFTILARD